ncbi:MAG: pseudouridine synthase [Polyangiaceae bacterium]|jgi:23S rRNA pseudouridine2605 synthase
MTMVRLQKVLARAGVASRRAAEDMIVSGRVRVDGRVVTQLGTRVDGRQSRVELDGQRIVRESPVYVMLHKPRGVVSTMHDPQGRPSVRELLGDVPARVFPLGRLDFNTSGVLLATNDGEFADGLLHPKRSVPKSYVIKVQGLMKPGDLDRWRQGVELEDGKTAPAKVKLLRHEANKTWLELTITEGRNQQIRRMGDATGFRVMRLARTSFAGIDSEGVLPGRWRYLKADELSALKKEYGVPRRVVSPPVEIVRRPPPRAAPRSEPQGAPHSRYGAGGPARRAPGGPSDERGARIHRGSTRGGPGSEDRPPRAEVGGRGSRTRTTGTGGGVGAGEGTFRVRARRGDR